MNNLVRGAVLALLSLALSAPARAQEGLSGSEGWTYAEMRGGHSASLRSRDGRSRIAVRCDKQDIPVISIQYLPDKPLGYSPSTPALSINGTPFERFSLVWENAPQGAYFADNGDADFTGTAFGYFLGIAERTTLALAAKGADGSSVTQEFYTDGDTNGAIEKVLTACGRDREEANPMLRGWQFTNTEIAGDPTFYARLASMEGRNTIEFRCTYADDFDISLILSGMALEAGAVALELDGRAVPFDWETEGQTRVLRNDVRIIQLAQLLVDDEPPMLGISRPDRRYRSAFLPPVDESRVALIQAFEMCNIPL